jgi:hypothetical protein
MCKKNNDFLSITHSLARCLWQIHKFYTNLNQLRIAYTKKRAIIGTPLVSRSWINRDRFCTRMSPYLYQ